MRRKPGGKGIMAALRKGKNVASKQVPVQIPTTAKKSRPQPDMERPSAPARYAWAVDEEPSDPGQFVELDATSETVLRLEIESLPEAFARLAQHLDAISGQEQKLLLRAWPHEHSAQVRAGAKELQKAVKALVNVIPS